MEKLLSVKTWSKGYNLISYVGLQQLMDEIDKKKKVDNANKNWRWISLSISWAVLWSKLRRATLRHYNTSDWKWRILQRKPPLEHANSALLCSVRLSTLSFHMSNISICNHLFFGHRGRQCKQSLPVWIMFIKRSLPCPPVSSLSQLACKQLTYSWQRYIV